MNDEQNLSDMEKEAIPLKKILLVEDDLEICEIVQFYLLEAEDYAVTVAHSSEQALRYIEKRQFDLALFDVMLPGMDGIELCRELRRTSYCPVIFISCINDDATIIRALNMGGDDYLVKPFQGAVLLARIEANIRRCRIQHPESKTVLRERELELDSSNRQVSKQGGILPLSPTEYEVLYYLMSRKGQFIPFDEIYQAVWQRPSLGDFRALFVHVSHLRQKIEDDPANPTYIRTHMRGGYIFSQSDARENTVV